MIAIIDYEAGNLTSVARALRSLDVSCEVTSDPDRIRSAERVIFPGVGAAGEAMVHLRRMGLDAVIWDLYRTGKPLLGICLGTQIVMEYSEENDTTCLGLIPGTTKGFVGAFSERNLNSLKIPHMGWNQVHVTRSHPVLAGIPQDSNFYFVHSYFPAPADPAVSLGITEYGIAFASALALNNLVALQFHPEKSGPVGLEILRNFSVWDGDA